MHSVNIAREARRKTRVFALPSAHGRKTGVELSSSAYQTGTKLPDQSTAARMPPVLTTQPLPSRYAHIQQPRGTRTVLFYSPRPPPMRLTLRFLAFIGGKCVRTVVVHQSHAEECLAESQVGFPSVKGDDLRDSTRSPTSYPVSYSPVVDSSGSGAYQAPIPSTGLCSCQGDYSLPNCSDFPSMRAYTYLDCSRTLPSPRAQFEGWKIGESDIFVVGSEFVLPTLSYICTGIRLSSSSSFCPPCICTEWTRSRGGIGTLETSSRICARCPFRSLCGISGATFDLVFHGQPAAPNYRWQLSRAPGRFPAYVCEEGCLIMRKVDVRLPGFPSDGTLDISETRARIPQIIEGSSGEASSRPACGKGTGRHVFPSTPGPHLRPNGRRVHGMNCTIYRIVFCRALHLIHGTLNCDGLVHLELTEPAILASQRTGWAVIYTTSSFLAPGTVAQLQSGLYVTRSRASRGLRIQSKVPRTKPVGDGQAGWGPVSGVKLAKM
ncbi:hypothetical protein B0H11DRAFT_2394317 [Mycena galericulata]|nr:hypothetical protein B0H11DRAFT_2394317 [Mycena galericulata]